MTLSTNTTILTPQAAALAEVGSSSTRGFAAMYGNLNALFIRKMGAFVNDHSGSAIFGTQTAPTQTVSWTVKTQPYAGLTGSDATAEVFVYHVQTLTTGTWSLRVTAPGGATVTTNMGTLGTSAGAWASLGTVQYDDTADTGVWLLSETANSGLAGTRGILGILIVPVRSATSLPDVSGGGDYSNAAADCYPFDSAVAWGTGIGVHSHALRYGHHMARYLWTRRVGQIITSSMHTHAQASKGTEKTMAKLVHFVPHKVTTATFYVRDSKDGSGTAKLYLDDTEVDSVTLANGGAWHELTTTVTPGTLSQFTVTADRDVDSICGHWEDADYP